ncbi:hypothetical protein [Nocardioides stalactiti]|uniref:hypothetical protein n=1 Tax=Nocardioides stalactiti TaxID=2755356 RepID=UPI001600E985|nr:hypothetical protein [Nocardioides stalactiti]
MRLLLFVLLAVPMLTACEDEADATTLVVSGSVDLCDADLKACQVLPARGADVEVLSGGEVVESSVLDDEGRLELDVEAGTYTATISYPDLDLASGAPASASVTLTEGETGELDVMIEVALTPGQGSGP